MMRVEFELPQRILICLLLWWYCYFPCNIVIAKETFESDRKSIDNVSLVIHRSGEPDGCGEINVEKTTSTIIKKDIIQNLDKYRLESYLTQQIAEALNGNICGSTDNATAIAGLYGFCDMGPDRTPILSDHQKLRRISTTNSLPCRWFTREGLRLSNWDNLVYYAQRTRQRQLELSQKVCENPSEPCVENDSNNNNNDNDDVTEIHIYGVPAGRVFMFAPSYVGETFELDHMKNRNDANETIILKVLSLNPRVFDIYNIFTPDEATSLMLRASHELSDQLKRSRTGTHENSVYSKRTSETLFDSDGPVATKLKKRTFELLGFDRFLQSHSDGIQILRYNLTKAYIPHMDYMTDRSGVQPFNYDASMKGGNRFATVLFYMTDLPDNETSGGETVFAEAWPEGTERLPFHEARKRIRESGITKAAGIEEFSWEEEMVVECRTKLAVKPYKGRAVLFYSQLPNGVPDQMSKHGGCPVLKGTKWAANLWIWSTPRSGFAGQPLREDLTPEIIEAAKKSQHDNQKKNAKFINSGTKYPDAELYYKDTRWGSLSPYDSGLVATTYTGHEWNVRVNGEIVKTWVIGEDENQDFIL